MRIDTRTAPTYAYYGNDRPEGKHMPLSTTSLHPDSELQPILQSQCVLVALVEIIRRNIRLITPFRSLRAMWYLVWIH